MTALCLQLQHHRRKPGRRCRRALWPPTNVKVLAEDTPQVASGKEDRAGTFPTPQAVLFAKVRRVARDHCVTPGLANGESVFQPVHSTITRPDFAGPQRPEGPFDPLGEFAVFVEAQIGGSQSFCDRWRPDEHESPASTYNISFSKGNNARCESHQHQSSVTNSRPLACERMVGGAAQFRM